jgi:uncharacterized protein (DUF302 family)
LWRRKSAQNGELVATNGDLQTFDSMCIIGDHSVCKGDIEMKLSPARFAAVLAFICVNSFVVRALGAGESAPKPEVTVTSVTHLNFKSSKPFDAVTAAIEKQLGKFDEQAYGAIMNTPMNAADVETRVHAMEGTSGFMLFTIRDHGQLLALKGKKASLKQYEIGNPLLAVEMTREDLRAGEYAPLRICVYTGEDLMTHVDYDLPSTVFGRFKSAQVDKVAKSLDEKLEALIANALKN